MASPEIDEAAAVEFFNWLSHTVRGDAARAALRWKELADEHSEICIIDLAAQTARAEAAEAERDSLRRQLAQAVKAR